VARAGCGDPVIASEYERVRAEIQRCGDAFMQQQLERHEQQVEAGRMSDCQKDARRKALVAMWDSWGST